MSSVLGQATRRSSAALGVALVVLAAACLDYVEPSHAGVAVDDAGQPVVRFYPCEADDVSSVSLFDYTSVTPEQPNPTPENEVWSIEAEGRVQTDSFVLGEVPGGFSETIPLREELTENREYHVGVATAGDDRAGSFTDFKLEDLVPGSVLVDGNRTIPEEEFSAWGSTQCAKDPLAETVRWWTFVGVGALIVVGMVAWLLVRSSRRSSPASLPSLPSVR